METYNLGEWNVIFEVLRLLNDEINFQNIQRVLISIYCLTIIE